jgi:hypothetical protein
MAPEGPTPKRRKWAPLSLIPEKAGIYFRDGHRPSAGVTRRVVLPPQLLDEMPLCSGRRVYRFRLR